MSSKNTFKNSAGHIVALALFTLTILHFSSAVSALADEDALKVHQQPQIKVIYPKPLQTVTATDSTFILGHLENISDEWLAALTINGLSAKLHSENTFLAFVPVQPDSFTFSLNCELSPKDKKSTAQPFSFSSEVKVFIPPPIPKIPVDTMIISRDYNGPKGDIVLSTGDELLVSFAATPSHFAWFSIPGVVDSVPMSETVPQNQTYWGEAVFGAGAVPDSLLLRGIYTGSWRIPSNARVDTAQIVY
ncbi:MAG: hypothetical protein ACREBV_03165, partial [Candidatus Zixiibacteriota bacterium]